MEKIQKYFDLLHDAGVCRAERIQADSIVTAPWTIYKCRYGCDFYGKSACCPPHAPTWKETKEIVDCYDFGILFNTNDDSWTGITPLAVELARVAFLDGYYKAIAFGSGLWDLRGMQCGSLQVSQKDSTVHGGVWYRCVRYGKEQWLYDRYCKGKNGSA